MAVNSIFVRAEWDPEARVWYVAETSLAGLNAEADTVEDLVQKLPGMVQDLLEEDGLWSGPAAEPLSIELTAHTTTIVPRAAA